MRIQLRSGTACYGFDFVYKCPITCPVLYPPLQTWRILVRVGHTSLYFNEDAFLDNYSYYGAC